jgi:hypothetical protein
MYVNIYYEIPLLFRISIHRVKQEKNKKKKPKQRCRYLQVKFKLRVLRFIEEGNSNKEVKEKFRIDRK